MVPFGPVEHWLETKQFWQTLLPNPLNLIIQLLVHVVSTLPWPHMTYRVQGLPRVWSCGELAAICGRVNETVADVVHRSTRRNTTCDHRVPY